MRSLNARMTLSEKESNYYWNIEKGFQGELKFDKWLITLPNNCLVLNDLLLEMNNSVFQIDTTLIFKGAIYPIDVKNYGGDSYVEGDRWYNKNSKKEIKNPLQQLNRSESLFRQLIKELGYQSPIETYLVFVNPDFYLYQAPIDPTFIFPTQINRFIDNLSKKPPTITKNQIKLAHQIRSLHSENSRFTRIPEYSYEQLEKGILCPSCHTFFSELKKSTLICKSCGCKEHITSAVLRTANELSLLFPDKNITISLMHDWCNIIKSRTTIRSILTKNYKLVSCGKSSYYD
ncbi:nuclease-related domain-containing protein [Alkalihalobacillus sp. AL-G]|uniref:nuclease-related domain-containing protein n=1 Tax=Alkalihalobacillus sp. AL-G TaxID=2926399 RepID=UPI00272D5665|nr:nuclease-related domain-containing protein [Alkalihalobacillus sp. AL-G]WLD93163.1 NERD domain-containing protein [Alkalihalobacillus sp. AL-G]